MPRSAGDVPDSSRPSTGFIARPTLCWLLLALVPVAAGLGCAQAISPRLIEDARTAVRVKSVLVNDPQLGTRLIEVRVSQGVARLSGSVASDAEAARAETLARSVPGVVSVESELQIRPAPGSEGTGLTPPADLDSEEDVLELGWLALGISASPRHTAEAQLGSGWTVGPLVRIGSRAGLGLVLGFSWFSADLHALSEAETPVGRVRIKPLMAGLGYTARRGRVSADLSIVGGLAFNRFVLTAVPSGEPVPVAVDDSLAWRPGVSVWYDPSRRAAVNVSLGYVMTRPSMTLLRDGRLDTRPLRADTTVVSVGLAYKLF